MRDHIDHIIAVASIETVGLDSDFDGGSTLFPDATETPRITDELIRRGYSDTEIRQILGGELLPRPPRDHWITN